jgi:hypothetical protein
MKMNYFYDFLLPPKVEITYSYGKYTYSLTLCTQDRYRRLQNTTSRPRGTLELALGKSYIQGS